MITIRLPRNLAELRGGLELIRQVYLQRFGTYPTEFPEILLMAFNGSQSDRPVGTMNLHIKKEGIPLEVERYFEIDLAAFCDYPGQTIAEVGRFTSLHEGLGTQLFVASGLFSIRFGIQRCISFNKTYISRLMIRVLGLPPQEIIAEPKRENVPDEYHAYFFSEDSLLILTWRIQSYIERIEQLRRVCQEEVTIEIPENLESYYKLLRSLIAQVA